MQLRKQKANTIAKSAHKYNKYNSAVAATKQKANTIAKSAQIQQIQRMQPMYLHGKSENAFENSHGEKSDKSDWRDYLQTHSGEKSNK